jgi:N utilization substance protein B
VTAPPEHDDAPPGAPADGAAHSHGRGRELALLLLCHLDASAAEERAEHLGLALREVGPDDGAVGELRRRLQDRAARRFAQRLLDVGLARWAELDAWIAATSRRWRLERMDVVDRNILRLAAAELRGLDTERAVVVAEAVRLAAAFGGERSAAFVNGLVADLCRDAGESSA